jgi:fructose-specific phosphotransferase system IIC component
MAYIDTQNERRQLQIRIAQLNADLQFYLAACFASFAIFTAFIVAAYQLSSPLKEGAFISAIVAGFLAGDYLYLVNKCRDEFKKLQ